MVFLVVPSLMFALAQLPSSPDVRPIPVSGVVVDAAGAPARDAEVWLIRANRPEEDRKSGMTLSWASQVDEDDQERDSRTCRHGRGGAIPARAARRDRGPARSGVAGRLGDPSRRGRRLAPAAQGDPARRPAAAFRAGDTHADRAHDPRPGWSARRSRPGSRPPGWRRCRSPTRWGGHSRARPTFKGGSASRGWPRRRSTRFVSSRTGSGYSGRPRGA